MNENVIFVPKRFNPLNVPKTCQIENFWINLVKQVNEGDLVTKTEQQLTWFIYCGEPNAGGQDKSQIDKR